MKQKFLANTEIRAAAKDAGVPLWVVADEIGLSDSSFSRLLRKDLPDAERQKILSIINRLATSEGGEHSV